MNINHNILNSDRNQLLSNKIFTKRAIFHYIAYMEILPPKQLEILLYLIKKFWVHTHIFISQGKIAKDCGVTRSYVNTCLKKFEKDLIISSIYVHRQAKTYLLHDILRTKEFKLRLSYIFKVPINDDIVIDSNLENYYKEVNSQSALNSTVYQKELTPSKEIKNYIPQVRDQDHTNGNAKLNNSPQQMRPIKDFLSGLVNSLGKGKDQATFDCKDIVAKLSVNEGCNIISKTVNLKNFKERKGTSIMDINISPALRKATELLKLTKWGQMELMRFDDVTLEHGMQYFDEKVDNPFAVFMKKCWAYYKTHDMRPQPQYNQIRDQIPKNARFTLSSRPSQTPSNKKTGMNVVQDKVQPKKVHTAIELANLIAMMKHNKQVSIDNLSKVWISKEETERLFTNILTTDIHSDYVTTGEKNEELAIMYIQRHRELFPIEKPEESKESSRHESVIKDFTFLEEMGMSPLKAEVINENQSLPIPEPKPIQKTLMEIFPNSIIEEHVDNEEVYEEVL